MSEWRWIDRTQPQTLQTGVILAYVTGIFALLGLLSFPYIGNGLARWTPMLASVTCIVAGAWGTANDKKWGWWLGVIGSSLYALLWLYVLVHVLSFWVFISLAFAVALVVLFVHPQSREYKRIWFR